MPSSHIEWIGKIKFYYEIILPPESEARLCGDIKIVGYQGKGNGRPIYEFIYKGKKQRVAITTGNNGFVIGANPVSF